MNIKTTMIVEDVSGLMEPDLYFIKIDDEFFEILPPNEKGGVKLFITDKNKKKGVILNVKQYTI
jgi:hypothetical protein